jgi:nitrate reductase gamma subunit
LDTRVVNVRRLSVTSWIEFGSGPLFTLCFVLMILGLLRVFFLSLYGMVEALHRAGDRKVPWKDLLKKTFSWMMPIFRLFRSRPLYSLVSFSFHVGLVLVPLFLAAHVKLFGSALGFSWGWLPQNGMDILTLVVIVAGVLLFFARLLSRDARQLSRLQDYLWPLLIAVPFATGYLCIHGGLSAYGYAVSMLIHVYSANLILVLIPFTKIAHCVLAPISHLVSGVGWKFPAGAGMRVAITLGKKGDEI